MPAWLVKTEPGTYSYDDLEREGRTRWDGVSNPQAVKNLGSMAVGDRVFKKAVLEFYAELSARP